MDSCQELGGLLKLKLNILKKACAVRGCDREAADEAICLARAFFCNDPLLVNRRDHDNS